METLRTEHVYILPVCCSRHSFMRCRGTGIGSTESINVQVNTLMFTETFPTMVNLELPNFHKWSRLIVARDTFTMIPPVYFELFAKFSQMCQVDCCWRLGCPKKTFFLKFLFKLLKNIPWKYPFVSFLCQKNPVQKSKICKKNFLIGNAPPPPPVDYCQKA